MERICFDVVYGEKAPYDYEAWIIDNEVDMAIFESWFYKAVLNGKKFGIFPFTIHNSKESDLSDS